MGEATAATRPVASPGAEELPASVSGQRHEIGSPVGRLTYYSAGPDAAGRLPPLLLVHSINAAGSAYEIRPLYEHYRQSRTVYALELPGFGHSERGRRKYSVRMMTDAILIMVREIQHVHGRAPLDALAVSLSSEFLARAITEMPLAFRTAALVSPTGFRRRDADTKSRNGTRAMPWLHALFEFPLWSEGFFRLLTSRAGIRYFLKKTWGSPDIDEGLAEYDYLTARQPGARHAPYYFVSGYLFSEGIIRIYHSLTLPVWMAHGVRGDFVDYTNKTVVQGRANWTIEVFPTGAMPHFEAKAAFITSYDAFLAGAPAASSA
ncbi:alpha/beta fold hydrolase [Bradyrhizobium sp.]|uniref:alpha/beta hydrolase n=1 Tax=Bradyrhizobium sp. TaxID=376 RepID=UPI000B192552|nr:alpha/beta fold hydrolase [Bradyrhizobium sp.]